MPLYVFYTMVQKSQKWPKTQIKRGSLLSVFILFLKTDGGVFFAVNFFFFLPVYILQGWPDS